MGSRVGDGFKLVKGKDGKTRLEPDEGKRLARLDVSTRQQVLRRRKTKVKYGKKGIS
jgi:hypothetical protein